MITLCAHRFLMFMFSSEFSFQWASVQNRELTVNQSGPNQILFLSQFSPDWRGGPHHAWAINSQGSSRWFWWTSQYSGYEFRFLTTNPFALTVIFLCFNTGTHIKYTLWFLGYRSNGDTLCSTTATISRDETLLQPLTFLRPEADVLVQRLKKHSWSDLI